MDEKRDPEVIALMQAVKTALGVEKTADLQDALVERKILRASQLRNLTRWVGGENAPGFHPTIALLRVAGRLRDEPAEQDEAERPDGTEAQPDPLEELRAAADELAAVIRQAIPLAREGLEARKKARASVKRAQG